MDERTLPLSCSIQLRKMQRFIAGVVLAVAGALLSPAQSPAANVPLIVVRRPTVVAFFAPVSQAGLKNDSDANEALADFQFYAIKAQDILEAKGIDFQEVYARSFLVQRGGKSTTFRSGKITVGYYLVSPDKEPRVEYGVMTDVDLLQVANDYFGLPAEKVTASDDCLQAEPLSPNLELSEDTMIRGHVKDQSGEPLRKSPIELRSYISQSEQMIVKRLSTDNDGGFDLGLVKHGSYRLLLSLHRGFQQPAKLECRQKRCVLDTVLIMNPTDLPAAGCPIR
jgi:hypothetical protein